jgi:hypothetical protein
MSGMLIYWGGSERMKGKQIGGLGGGEISEDTIGHE